VLLPTQRCLLFHLPLSYLDFLIAQPIIWQLGVGFTFYLQL
jgi:hypothetical protein